MYFDCSKEEDRKKLMIRIQFLLDKEKKVEITEKREKRTLNQNSYLHLLLSWFGAESGNTLDYVKEEYFKKLCNSEIFLYEKEDPYLGKVKVIRSSSDIDTKQMTLAIDRFRNWSSAEAGIYLPDANEEQFLTHIQEELRKYQQWL